MRLQIPSVDATRRLAVVDLDWGAVRAVDIMVVLRSFLPRGGHIERVTVYPSDYGLERMAQEAAAGPQVGAHRGCCELLQLLASTGVLASSHVVNEWLSAAAVAFIWLAGWQHCHVHCPWGDIGAA